MLIQKRDKIMELSKSPCDTTQQISASSAKWNERDA